LTKDNKNLRVLTNQSPQKLLCPRITRITQIKTA